MEQPAGAILGGFRAAEAAGLAPARTLDTQRSFASILGRATAAPPESRLTDEGRAREAAEQLVTQTFVVPMLKQLRETNTAAAPFAPTQAERQFRALADADLAQRIVKAARFPLVERLARDLLKRAGKDAQGRAAADELAAAARTAVPPQTSPGVNIRGATK